MGMGKCEFDFGEVRSLVGEVDRELGVLLSFI